jgi:hypothetical protein
MASVIIFVVAARADFDNLIHAKLVEFIAAGEGFDAFFFGFAFHLRHTTVHIVGRVIIVITFVFAFVVIFRGAFFITFVIIFVVIVAVAIIMTLAVLIVPLGIIHLLITHLRNPPYNKRPSA